MPDAYARVDQEYNKMLDEQEQWAELADDIEDSIKWAGEALRNFRHSNQRKLERCKCYLEETIERINNELEKMDV